jgi:hypothetical protein
MEMEAEVEVEMEMQGPCEEVKGTSVAYDVLSETRGAIEEILARLLFIKKEGRSRAELRELFTQASVAFLSLRQVFQIPVSCVCRVPSTYTLALLPTCLHARHIHVYLYMRLVCI